MQATCQIQLCFFFFKQTNKLNKMNVGEGIWKDVYLNFYYTFDVKNRMT